MRFVVAVAAAGAMALGCSSGPTTLRLDVQAAAGVSVQSLTLRLGLPGGATVSEMLPPGGATPRLPGRVVIKFPDVAMAVDVALDGIAAGGQPLFAGATVLIVPHHQVSQTLTVGDATGADDMSLAGGDVDMATTPIVDMAAPPGSDLACTLGARCAYAFRRALSITNGSAAALPAGYTVRVPLDPLLFPAAKVRADLNDVRLFMDSSGVEFDRVVDLAPPGQGRALWLALKDPLAAGATETRYSVYYDFPTAGAPPADATKVFALWDGFDGVQVSSQWVTNGGPVVSGGFVRLHQNTQDALATIYNVDKVPTLSALEWRFRISDPASAGTAPAGNFYWYWIGFQRQQDFQTTDPWLLWISRGANDLGEEVKIAGGACAAGCTGTLVTPDTAYHWYRIERDPTVTRFYRDGALIGTPIAAVNDTDFAVMMRNFAATSDLDVDWIRARELASPEPTVVVGAEQPVP
jgi:hypothetical protein